MKKLVLCSLLALSPVMLTGCNDNSTSPTSSSAQSTTEAKPETVTETVFKTQYLENHQFKLVEFNGKAIAVEPAPFIQFNDEMRVSGQMCNHFFGQTTLDDNQLKGTLGMTLMYCDNPELNTLDQVIGKMFTDGVKISDTDGRLTFTQGDNTLVYVFDKMVEVEKMTSHLTEQDLIHHQFQLISIDGRQVDANEMATLEFGENFQLSGQACNHFSGKATLKDDIITAPVLAMTRKLCNSETLNQLDSKIAQIFAQGVKVSLNDKGALTLVQGDTTLVYQLNDVKN